MRLNLMAHTEMHSGYGRFGAMTKQALKELGVESSGDIGLYPEKAPNVSEPVLPDGTVLEHTALWLSTPPHVRGWYEGQFAAIFTMWESTEMPPGFRQNLHHFDRIFVPSLQNKELFERFHDDVRYIPLGISPEWGYRQRPRIERTFNFLTAGYGPRKGCAQVAEAFLTVFPGGKPPSPDMPVPHLTVRSRDDIHGPGIGTIGQDLSNRAELDLYGDAHCFVSGSKGEGFGFMPLQAICQGLPTILGDAHGHAAYAHYGIPLETHPYECKGATFWGDGGEWWEPDFDQMCDAMWEVYNDYFRYETIAASNAMRAAQEFTWERTAREIIINLDDDDEHGRPIGNHLFYEGPIAKVWKGALPKLFHIRVNKECAYTINGVKHAFNPGIDYYESADLKRAIVAAGHLDMATFDPHDLGLEDNADIAALRARNSVCPTCHQPYNRDDTLKELFA